MKNKFGIPGFTKEGYFKKLVDEGIVNDNVKLSDLKKFDAVDYPAHYNQGGIQCIDAIASMQGKPIEDLDKAIWFLNKLKAQYE